MPPLNNRILAMFFPTATIPATSHYSEFTDKSSPEYGRLSFSLHFMTNNHFFDLSSLTFTSSLNHTANPILWTPAYLIPLSEF